MTRPAGTRSRHLERPAVTALLPVAALIPFWLLAMAVVWLPLRVAFATPYIFVPTAWLLIGALLLIPVVQIGVLTRLLGARRPSVQELSIINPIWRNLTAVANMPQLHYTIRVIDSEELNAFACGGRLVIVTTFAIEKLTPSELSGVLAHELSHHLGLHTGALTLGHWLSIPVLLLARFGFFLQNVASAATSAFASRSIALTAMGKSVAALVTAVSWFFLAALYATDALGNLVGHGSEFAADRRAVRMGYGRPLADALWAVTRHGGGRRAIGWKARIASSHPPARTRVARIEAMLRHPGH